MAQQEMMTTMMARGNDDNYDDGDSAKGDEVDDDCDATGNGATGYDNDDDGNGATCDGTMGYDDYNNGDGQR